MRTGSWFFLLVDVGISLRDAAAIFILVDPLDPFTPWVLKPLQQASGFPAL